MNAISGLKKEGVTAVAEWVNGKDPEFFSVLGLRHLNTVGLSASH